MKTYMVMGVECVKVKVKEDVDHQIEALGKDLGVADEYDDPACTLCPAEKARTAGDKSWRNACNCNGNGYLPKQYAAIAIMRGITIKEDK